MWRCRVTWVPKKPEASGEGRPKPPHADPGQFGSDYPALAFYVCASQWPDGTPKNPGRVEVSVWANKFQATLKVPGLGLMLRVEIPEPGYEYAALDAILRTENVPWVVDQWTGSESAKKSQKK